jgi:hypothetical protein
VADTTNAPVQQTDSMAPAPESKGNAGFLATTTGKVVVGAIALLVLLVIAGAIVAMIAFGGAEAWLKSGRVVVTTTSTTAVVSTAATTTVPVTEPSTKPLTDSFTFRNVFAPSIKPPVPPAAETSASAGSSTSSPDTLYLIDIVATDAGREGVFVWNGVTYTEGAGSVIDSSPWKVLEVGTDSVLLLFGDTQVTLTLGQGISK